MATSLQLEFREPVVANIQFLHMLPATDALTGLGQQTIGTLPFTKSCTMYGLDNPLLRSVGQRTLPTKHSRFFYYFVATDSTLVDSSVRGTW